jgi:hypothetical protein
MKVFLGIIGTISMIGSALYGVDGLWQMEKATMVTHQNVALGHLTVGCLLLLIACVCFSACIKATSKDIEELRQTIIKYLSELKHEVSKK